MGNQNSEQSSDPIRAPKQSAWTPLLLCLALAVMATGLAARGLLRSAPATLNLSAQDVYLVQADGHLWVLNMAREPRALELGRTGSPHMVFRSLWNDSKAWSMIRFASLGSKPAL